MEKLVDLQTQKLWDSSPGPGYKIAKVLWDYLLPIILSFKALASKSENITLYYHRMRERERQRQGRKREREREREMLKWVTGAFNLQVTSALCSHPCTS